MPLKLHHILASVFVVIGIYLFYNNIVEIFNFHSTRALPNNDSWSFFTIVSILLSLIWIYAGIYILKAKPIGWWSGAFSCVLFIAMSVNHVINVIELNSFFAKQHPIMPQRSIMTFQSIIWLIVSGSLIFLLLHQKILSLFFSNNIKRSKRIFYVTSGFFGIFIFIRLLPLLLALFG